MPTIVTPLAGGPQMESRLDAELRPLLCQGVACAVDVSRRGDAAVFDCRIGGTDPDPRGIPALARAVGDWILGPGQQRLLSRLLAGRWPFLPPEARRLIVCRLAVSLPSGSASPWSEGITEAVRAYFLGGSELLVVEGFVRFRLKAYVDRLVAAVDREGARCCVHWEHRHLLRLLGQELRLRPPGLSTVHCVWAGAERGVRVLDAEGRPLVELPLDGEDDGQTYALAERLAALAPQEVVLHLPEAERETAWVAALGELFPEGRIVRCFGCPHCRQNQDMV